MKKKELDTETAQQALPLSATDAGNHNDPLPESLHYDAFL